MDLNLEVNDIEDTSYSNYVYECSLSFLIFNTVCFFIVLLLSLGVTIRHKNKMKFSNFLLIYVAVVLLAARGSIYVYF
jgi:hypothetical protein